MEHTKSERWVVVGNGPIISPGLGSVIDSYDEILRFNRFKFSSFGVDVGIKTTAWMTSVLFFPREMKRRLVWLKKHLDKIFLLLCFSERYKKLLHCLSLYSQEKIPQEKLTVFLSPSKHFLTVLKQSKVSLHLHRNLEWILEYPNVPSIGKGMTTGFCAILYLLQKPNVTLPLSFCNFGPRDTFVNKQYYGLNKHGRHAFNAERKALNDLESYGLVRRIDG